MRVFVTGGTGFIGGRLVERLRSSGADVAALVRNPQRAGALGALGCEIVEGDLEHTDAIRRGVDGADAVYHVAAVYSVGVPVREREPMRRINVEGTERVLDAAIAAGVPRIVHVSTVNAFGNTRGVVVDETYSRPENDRYLSYYDETKHRAHLAALTRIADGAPIVVAQPGAVYGPGDHSELGTIIEQVRTGRMPFLSFGGMGVNMVHVEDAAEGIALCGDRGTPGECYVLGGELATLREIARRVAALAGRRPPRLELPSMMIRAGLPMAPLITRVMGLPPNLRELISASDGVTYFARDDKARRELGYRPRDLDTGLRQTVEAAAAA